MKQPFEDQLEHLLGESFASVIKRERTAFDQLVAHWDGKLVLFDAGGAEAEALGGASMILTQNRPKLAISSYHYPTDLWTIPLLSKRLNPAYKLFMRYYSREIDDTVCYAVPD
jgi:hypothetical protein